MFRVLVTAFALIWTSSSFAIQMESPEALNQAFYEMRIAREAQEAIDFVQNAVKNFNSVASAEKQIVTWQSDKATIEGETELTFRATLRDGSNCKLDSYYGAAKNDFYNSEYFEMNVICEGSNYMLVKKVMAKDLFDNMNPGPNNGITTYEIW